MIFAILEQSLIFLPLVIGAYVTISLLKLPDFSIESAYLFGAVFAFVFRDFPLPFILFGSVLGGMAVGATVSLLHQIFRLPFLLSAVITNGFFHGATQFVLRTSVIRFHPVLPFSDFILEIGIAVFLLVSIGFGLRSQLGYAFAIYGNNALFFKNYGISSRYVLIFGVMIGHGCAGISGFLFAQSNGFVDLTMSFGVILMCLTSLILGKRLVPTTCHNILIPIAGIIAYFCIQQTLLRLGLNLKYFNAFQALFVLSALLLGRRKQKNVELLGV